MDIIMFKMETLAELSFPSEDRPWIPLVYLDLSLGWISLSTNLNLSKLNI